mgnify:FL=1
MTIYKMNCTLCNTKLYETADGYYYICTTCGAYVKDEKYYLSSKKEKKRYKQHENDVNDKGYQRFTSPITDAILENHSADQLGLDYGSGTASVIAKQLQEQDYQVKLYDPFFYPDQDYLNHCYDYIFSCEVFEHFYNPKEEIEKLLSLLKPNGLLYIMTHLYSTDIDFENWYYRNDRTHVFIYTSKTIAYIAGKYKLDIVHQTDRLIVLRKLIG